MYRLRILRERRQRTGAGLAIDPPALAIGRMIVVAIGVLAAVGIMSVNRNPGSAVPICGIPSGVICFVGCIVVFDLIIRRTRFGGAIFAVGGNAEALKRYS